MMPGVAVLHDECDRFPGCRVKISFTAGRYIRWIPIPSFVGLVVSFVSECGFGEDFPLTPVVWLAIALCSLMLASTRHVPTAKHRPASGKTTLVTGTGPRAGIVEWQDDSQIEVGNTGVHRLQLLPERISIPNVEGVCPAMLQNPANERGPPATVATAARAAAASTANAAPAAASAARFAASASPAAANPDTFAPNASTFPATPATFARSAAPCAPNAAPFTANAAPFAPDVSTFSASNRRFPQQTNQKEPPWLAKQS